MAQIRLTKTELRSEQVKLAQLQKYLPTLQLKKSLLQAEVNQAMAELEKMQCMWEEVENTLQDYAQLFSDRSMRDFFPSVKIIDVRTQQENIAGVEIPIFCEVHFADATYSLFDTPVWFETVMKTVQQLLTLQEKARVMQERKDALARELREVSIRVNLFEKILIPRSMGNIKRIKIFLGDQQLAAVAQAKVSKKKIIQRSLHDHKSA